MALETRPGLDAQAIRLIGALKFDPGYLLLLDYLQAKLDTLTDELADRTTPETEALSRLRYWQAFRDLLYTLKVQPDNFAKDFAADKDSDSYSEEENLYGTSDWARLQRQAQAVESALADRPNPVA